MRKILFILLFSIVAGNAVFAQDFHYGFALGADISKYNVNYPIEYDKGYTDYQYKAGFRIALVLEYALIPNTLHISSELAFTQRGAKQQQTDSIFSKYKYNINYLELPVNILYKIEIAENTKFIAFAGPYLSYALSGKRTAENKPLRTGQTWNNSVDYEFGSELKPFDLGFNVGFGFEYSEYFLKFQYNHGLINTLYEAKYYQKNRNFGISVGYLF
jgi:hypothetical protein